MASLSSGSGFAHMAVAGLLDRRAVRVRVDSGHVCELVDDPRRVVVRPCGECVTPRFKAAAFGPPRGDCGPARRAGGPAQCGGLATASRDVGMHGARSGGHGGPEMDTKDRARVGYGDGPPQRQPALHGCDPLAPRRGPRVNRWAAEPGSDAAVSLRLHAGAGTVHTRPAKSISSHDAGRSSPAAPPPWSRLATAAPCPLAGMSLSSMQPPVFGPRATKARDGLRSDTRATTACRRRPPTSTTAPATAASRDSVSPRASSFAPR